MKFNKFKTVTLSNVTGSCIRPLKCLKNIAFTSKRIEVKLTKQNRPYKQLTDEEINSADEEYIVICDVYVVVQIFPWFKIFQTC